MPLSKGKESDRNSEGINFGSFNIEAVAKGQINHYVTLDVGQINHPVADIRVAYYDLPALCNIMERTVEWTAIIIC